MLHPRIHSVALASIAALPIVSVMAESALADKSNFYVYNDSNSTITQLFISESNRESWDNDILGSDVLPIGSNIQVMFGNLSSDSCLYDILAIFDDGQSVEDYQINVCSGSGYTFYSE